MKDKQWGFFTKCILYLMAWLNYLDRKRWENINCYNYSTFNKSLETLNWEYHVDTIIYGIYGEIPPFNIIKFYMISFNISYLNRYNNIIVKIIMILMHIIFGNKLSRYLMNKYSRNHMMKNELFYLENVVGFADEQYDNNQEQKNETREHSQKT